MYQTLLGLKYLYRDHPSHATTTVLPTEQHHTKRFYRRIFIFHFQKKCKVMSRHCVEEDGRCFEASTESDCRWVKHAVVWFQCHIFLQKQPNNCIWGNYLRLFWNIQHLFWIVRQRLTSTWFSTPSTAWCAGALITPLRRRTHS